MRVGGVGRVRGGDGLRRGSIGVWARVVVPPRVSMVWVRRFRASYWWVVDFGVAGALLVRGRGFGQVADGVVHEGGEEPPALIWLARLRMS